MTESLKLKLAGQTLTVSNPDKIFFTRNGQTKHDLIEYYQEVAGPLLAVTGGRPTLMQRFPDGASGKSFFQKRVPKGSPEWLQTTTVSTPNGTTSNAMVLGDIAHVAWAAQMGCLGFHPWPYQADDPEHTDELRIDLDPSPGIDFCDIVASTKEVRSFLDELGITSHIKTTGSRGLHIFVRLLPLWDSFEVRAAAVALARELERRHPTTITAQWWKEERGSRVFVDYNQNAPHKTVFGAWSVRPRVGAQVSTPFSWDDIDKIKPDDLTMDTVPQRLASEGDPWADMYDNPNSLQPLLEMSETDMEGGLMDAPWPPVYPKQPNEPPRVAPSRAKNPMQ